jgi:predicted amidophosphoribosyltransferase
MLSKLFSKWVICRSCLKLISEDGEAGLCGACWGGLWPLTEYRCPKCALSHGSDRKCPDPVAWEHGDALWNYRGGRPALGSLLINGIKSGERGWKRELLKRLARSDLPPWAFSVDMVTSAPPSPIHKFLRGFDLAREAALVISGMVGSPYARTLKKILFAARQAKRTESQRRKMPQKNLYVRKGAQISGKTILIVDDVWTTGTTLLRCAKALQKAGAKEVRVLSLFRAI